MGSMAVVGLLEHSSSAVPESLDYCLLERPLDQLLESASHPVAGREIDPYCWETTGRTSAVELAEFEPARSFAKQVGIAEASVHCPLAQLSDSTFGQL